MVSREELQAQLEVICPNVYYQPPSSIRMQYPCIVYARAPNLKQFANDGIYTRHNAYSITVMDRDPESTIAETLEDTFMYCSITQHYVVDNLHHATLNLYI